MNFVSSKDAKEGVMHSRSNNEEFMIDDNANALLKNF